MIRSTLALTALALLAACGDGQPFPDTAGGTAPASGGGTTGGGGLETGGATPPLPGTASPTPESGIVRFEASAADGTSLIQDVSYDAATDTFRVDGVGFDGQNVYTRMPGALRTVGPTRVFQADLTTPDSVTGTPIVQFDPYRAMYGVSRNRTDGEPRTSFAIVRTGAYAGYGFGGYVYQRNGGVTLPSTGQAVFAGDYAGMRVFEGQTGLEYTTGDMRLQIDFEDFNANDAVVGEIRNRVTIDEDGNVSGALPNVGWVVQEGTPVITANGEISGELFSNIADGQGGITEYETGTFNGIIAGDLTSAPGGEIVGVVVLEGQLPNTEITSQETGGVVLYRD